jgi:hypothetical protein
VPAVRPDIVVLVPVPGVVVPPGVLVKVQFPADGRLLNATLPVTVAQVGWVIVPTTGVEGGTQRVVNVTSLFAYAVPALFVAYAFT